MMIIISNYKCLLSFLSLFTCGQSVGCKACQAKQY